MYIYAKLGFAQMMLRFQWNLKHTRAEAEWNLPLFGSTGLTVCVLIISITQIVD